MQDRRRPHRIRPMGAGSGTALKVGVAVGGLVASNEVLHPLHDEGVGVGVACEFEVGLRISSSAPRVLRPLRTGGALSSNESSLPNASVCGLKANSNEVLPGILTNGSALGTVKAKLLLADGV